MATTTLGWYLRGCPACKGDLHDDPQDAGWVTCLMCGRYFNLTGAPPVRLSDKRRGYHVTRLPKAS
jgi:uncharacterized protein YbaR (Trm112 family)